MSVAPPCDPAPVTPEVVCGQPSTHHLRVVHEWTGDVRESYVCGSCARRATLGPPILTLVLTPLAVWVDAVRPANPSNERS